MLMHTIFRKSFDDPLNPFWSLIYIYGMTQNGQGISKNVPKWIRKRESVINSRSLSFGFIIALLDQLLLPGHGWVL